MNEILNASEMKRIIMRMYHEFVEDVQDLKKVSLIGIRSGGVFLAERLKQYLKEFDDLQVDMGFLDITLYRDDLSRLGYLPTLKKTDIQFSIDNRIILLVDDVIYSGRTIRAAMDALIDFGRPAVIKLAVLIDRGGRELPIQPDYTGRKITAKKNEIIDVHFKEQGYKEDCVVLRKK